MNKKNKSYRALINATTLYSYNIIASNTEEAEEIADALTYDLNMPHWKEIKHKDALVFDEALQIHSIKECKVEKDRPKNLITVDAKYLKKRNDYLEKMRTAYWSANKP